MEKGRALEPHLRAQLTKLAAELGAEKLAQEVGLHIGTLSRITAGFPCYGSSIGAVRWYLSERARTDKTA